MHRFVIFAHYKSLLLHRYVLSAIITAVNVKDDARQEFVVGTCKVIDGQGNVLHLAHAVHRIDGGNALFVLGAGLDGVLHAVVNTQHVGV